MKKYDTIGKNTCVKILYSKGEYHVTGKKNIIGEKHPRKDYVEVKYLSWIIRENLTA